MTQQQPPFSYSELQEKLTALEEKQRILQEKAAAMQMIMEDLAEVRRQAEENEAKFRAIFESAMDGIILVDLETKRLYLPNRQFCKMLGYTPTELERLTIADLHPPETLPWIRDLLEQKRQDKVDRAENVPVCKKDGSIFYADITTGLVILEDRRYLAGIFRDITDRLDAREKLHQREAELASIYDSVPVGISHVINRRFIRVNRIFCRFFGYTEDELIGNDTSRLYGTAEEFRHWGQVLYDQLHRQQEVTQEICFRHKDGHRMDFLIRGVYLDPSDPSKGELFALTDITDRKQAERALEFTQFAVEHVSTPMYWMDSNLKFFYVNDAACRSLEYTREELLAMSVFDIDPDYTRQIAPVNWQILKQQGVQTFETRHRTRSGKIFPVEITANFLIYEGVEYNCAFAVDITERKRAEEALAESEQRFRQMFEKMSSAVVIYKAVDNGQDFVLADLNPSVERIEQCSREDILGRRVTEVFPGVEAFGLLEVFRRVYQTGQPAYHPVSQYQDERISGWRENYVYKLSSGEIVALYDDVTEKKQAEEAREKLLKELRSKNEELENIVFIASHDLRSPLVNIEGFTGEVKKSCQEIRKLLGQVQCPKEIQKQFDYLLDSDIPESIGFISAGTGKMDTLLSGLLRLSRIGTATIHIEPVNMKMLVQTVLGTMRFQIRQLNVDISLGDLPNCMGDAVQVNQVFSNLIDNAIKYRHPDRPLRVRVEGRTEGQAVIYSIADNGIGIDPQHFDKIFEIFHQLDPGSRQRGEGLGLTIVRRILDRLDGRIWVESEPGVGATFFVALPMAR